MLYASPVERGNKSLTKENRVQKRAIFRLRNSIASLSFLLDTIATSIL